MLGEPGWKSSNVGLKLGLCGYWGVAEVKSERCHLFLGHGENTCLGTKPGSKYGKPKAKSIRGCMVHTLSTFRNKVSGTNPVIIIPTCSLGKWQVLACGDDSPVLACRMIFFIKWPFTNELRKQICLIEGTPSKLERQIFLMTYKNSGHPSLTGMHRHHGWKVGPSSGGIYRYFGSDDEGWI